MRWALLLSKSFVYQQERCGHYAFSSSRLEIIIDKQVLYLDFQTKQITVKNWHNMISTLPVDSCETNAPVAEQKTIPFGLLSQQEKWEN